MHGDGGVRVARRACTKCSRMIIRGGRGRREKERKRERQRKKGTRRIFKYL